MKKEPYDSNTGEIYSGLLWQIQVSDSNFELKPLSRRAAYDVETHHRELMRKNREGIIHIGYKIHRDNLIAEKFMPLIKLENGNFRKGFSVENSVDYKRDDFEKIKDFLYPSKGNQNVYLVRKKEALGFLMDVGRHGPNGDKQKTAKLLDGLIYQTVKKEISSVLTPQGKQPPKTVGEALERWDALIKPEKFKKDGVTLPVFGEWEKLKSELGAANPNQDFQVCLRKSKMFSDKQNSSIGRHNKKRKVYSLPIIAGIGSIRLKRRAWNGQSVIQTAADEAISKYGLDSKQRPHTVLSRNSIPVKHYSGTPGTLHPEPREWKEIPDEGITKHNSAGGIQIISGLVKYQDAGRCRVNLRVADIQKLSLPQDKNNWRGKLFRHEKVKIWKEKVEKEMGDNCHFMAAKWQWFSKPFALPNDRNEVILKDLDGIYEIEFVIQKTADIKRWLLS